MPLHHFFRLPPKLRRRARRHRMLTLLFLLLVLFLFVLPLWYIYHPPFYLINYFTKRWPDVLFQVPLPADKKLVALTIDDAPSQHTFQILQTLKEFDAHATFFVIGGQVPGKEEQLKFLVSDGMELGNHAMHDAPSRELSDEELAGEIGIVRDKIRTAYKEGARLRYPELDDDDVDGDGHVEPPPLYFRPGSGLFSDRMRRLVHGLGYRIVLGGIYPHDAQIGWWRLNAAHILSLVRPGGIIICHDRRSWTVPMLRKVLPELRSRGYKVVTVSELIQAGKEVGSITQ
ncbi:carbohydrate esterase family 4 protein [Zalerion maritima]|uniref:chitin deacetylase n=1 Tax=Zalerion maritima TaxID=339359 RepID=A0AAD5WR28_9PEZI|nr:carbohydrate esterase family 4 protein [Zalerion maritima]